MKLPKIKAEFVLDPQGRPKGRSSQDYAIRLTVADIPENAHRVTYQLDGSYYDPVRDVRTSSNGFAEELTSYGDFEVKAAIRLKDHSILTSRRLAEALVESHGGSTEPTVLRALKDISGN